MRILCFVEEVLNRHYTVLKAAESSAENRTHLEQLHAVTEEYGSLDCVFVSPEVLDTVCHKARKQLVIKL